MEIVRQTEYEGKETNCGLGIWGGAGCDRDLQRNGYFLPRGLVSHADPVAISLEVPTHATLGITVVVAVIVLGYLGGSRLPR